MSSPAAEETAEIRASGSKQKKKENDGNGLQPISDAKFGGSPGRSREAMAPSETSPGAAVFPVVELSGTTGPLK